MGIGGPFRKRGFYPILHFLEKSSVRVYFKTSFFFPAYDKGI